MRKKERIVWISITAVVFFSFAALGLAPARLDAQTNYDQSKDYLDLFEQIFRFVERYYVDEVPPETLYEGALKGLFDSLDDPYSYYLTASDMEDLSDTTTGKFGGVGLYISKAAPGTQENVPNSQYVNVVSPIEDTPAYRAGIHAGDYITQIDGEPVDELNSDEVVDRLRGEPGSDVVVKILRGKDIRFDVTITRAIIEVPTVKYDMMPDNLGYIRIIQFTPYTDDRVKEALESFKRDRFRGLIIDVRGNPGGLLTSVVSTADFFLSGGTIVSTRSRIPSENEVFTARRAIQVNSSLPIVVLIDNGSASASEILAGALKDTERATLVGTTTFGKGSVQQVHPVGAGGFKLTMSRYYTPGGNNIDKIGIEPHITIEEDEFSEEEQQAYRTLLEENRISLFVGANPDPSEAEIDAFIADLNAEGLVLEDRILRRLIRQEIHRKMDFPPVYDLDYDIALRKAVEVIESETASR